MPVQNPTHIVPCATSIANEPNSKPIIAAVNTNRITPKIAVSHRGTFFWTAYS